MCKEFYRALRDRPDEFRRVDLANIASERALDLDVGQRHCALSVLKVISVFRLDETKRSSEGKKRPMWLVGGKKISYVSKKAN